MSAEEPKNPQQIKEAVFQNWLTEFQGRFWLNPDAMPEAVFEAIQTYEHFDAHKDFSHKDQAPEKMKEATENFKKLTGYDLRDFLDYQEAQSQKLKNEGE